MCFRVSFKCSLRGLAKLVNLMELYCGNNDIAAASEVGRSVDRHDKSRERQSGRGGGRVLPNGRLSLEPFDQLNYTSWIEQSVHQVNSSWAQKGPMTISTKVGYFPRSS